MRRSNSDIKLEAIVLNRAVVHPGQCGTCRQAAQRVLKARRLLVQQFGSAKIYLAEDPGSPILGAAYLQKFAAHVFHGKPLKWSVRPPHSRREFAFRPASWPNLTAPLSFVLGKGGVGKTTISAGLGYIARRRLKVPVAICSVDPAPVTG